MAHRLLVPLVALAALPLVVVPRAARASDCPAGSTSKSEDGFTWCQPSVCQNDGNCLPSEVCRPVPLCVQVGKLDDKHEGSDAAQRLVATQRCAPDKSCPDSTTCSDMSRCVSKAAAEKMGMLTAAGDAPGAGGAAGSDAAPKKSSCGCRVAGGRTDGAFGLALAGLGLAAALGSRRIHRRRPIGRARRD